MSAGAVAADGEKLYSDNACATCHGATGNEPILPTYPKISGQNTKYLIGQMNDIKNGTRDNGMSAAMRALVSNLDEDDIVAIAEYLSQQ
jgi:cytochrome c